MISPLNRRLMAACAAMLMLTGSQALADSPSWFGSPADGNWYIGGKVATVEYGPNRAFGNAQTLAVVGGYQFSRNVHDRGTASIEFELSGTINDGDIQDSGDDWDVGTVEGHFVYRTPGDVYAKGKLGIMHSTVDHNGLEESVSDTHVSYGGGLGVRLNRFNIEVEYTGALGDNDLNRFSVGGLFHFQ